MATEQSPDFSDEVFTQRPVLVDGFGRVQDYLRISVTERCNLRCVYCMPAGGLELKPRESILHFEEILRLTKLFRSLGVNKVRFTGGEPLVRKNLEELIGEVSALSGIDTIGLTTNGVLLEEKVATLRKAGVTTLNISLDTLQAELFSKIALRATFEKVLHGIEAALALNFRAIKLNMVVMGGINDAEVLDYVELARSERVDVRFIEFMPFAGNHWKKATLVPSSETRRLIEKKHKMICINEDDPSRVTREYHIEGFAGTVGFISSMTEHFCDGCSRLRLTADGSLKTCLFHNPEMSLRDAMRDGASDEELEVLIRQAVAGKPKGHEGMDKLAEMPNRSMIQIGG